MTITKNIIIKKRNKEKPNRVEARREKVRKKQKAWEDWDRQQPGYININERAKEIKKELRIPDEVFHTAHNHSAKTHQKPSAPKSLIEERILIPEWGFEKYKIFKKIVENPDVAIRKSMRNGTKYENRYDYINNHKEGCVYIDHNMVVDFVMKAYRDNNIYKIRDEGYKNKIPVFFPGDENPIPFKKAMKKLIDVPVVYGIRNLVLTDCWYVGETINGYNRHSGYGGHFSRNALDQKRNAIHHAKRMYGFGVFAIYIFMMGEDEIVHSFNRSAGRGGLKDSLLHWEDIYTQLYNSHNNGYNILPTIGQQLVPNDRNLVFEP